MDTRDTPEQAELRRAARQLARRARARDRRRPRRRDACASASPRRCATRVGSSCATTRARGRRSRAGSRPRSSPTRSAAAVADVAFAGPVLARDLARRAGVRADRRRRRRVLARRSPARPSSPAPRPRPRRLRGRQRRRAHRRPRTCWCPRARATGSARVPVDGAVRRRRSHARRCASVPAGAPVHAVADQRRLLTRDDLVEWTALGLALDERRSRRRHARRARRHGRLRRRAPAVRRPDRFVPGRAAPARRSALPDGGFAQRLVARVVGGRQSPARRGARGRPRRQGVLRPRRAHRVRDGGAGARRDRQHVGVHRARVPAPRAAVVAVVRRRRRAAPRAAARTPGGDTMDFRDSPAEAEFRARLRAWLAENDTAPADVVDRRRVLGPPGRVAHRAVRRRLLRPELAGAFRRARAAHRVRRHPRRGARRAPARRRGRASAISCKASRRTAATRSRTGSFPG